MNKTDIVKILKDVRHPGRGDKDILELGMVQDVLVGNDGIVTVVLAFPKKDPLEEYVKGSTRAVIFKHFSEVKDVDVKVVEERVARHDTVDELTFRELDDVRHIIGIASGKGGVGKSTVSVNLAVALVKKGYKVGLADADVYGPSVPMMTSTIGALPRTINENGRNLIVPVEKFGVKWMSIGYFARQEQALIWRGPMACSALKQMILQVRWGNLDYLLIDMPPGTGDIHISLVQDIPIEGAIVVTTPQLVALADVEKSVDMFRNPGVNRRIYGLVENMSWFTPEELPENRYYIFGKAGGVRMAERLRIPFLGQIPIVQNIRECGDKGSPVALATDNEGNPRIDAKAFADLAETVANITDSEF